MLRRYLFIWLAFFLFILALSSGWSLYFRWKTEDLLLKAESRAFTEQCLHDFTVLLQTGAKPTDWNWDRLYDSWKNQFDCIQAVALVDVVDGTASFSKGLFSPSWNPILLNPTSDKARWILTDSGERFWYTPVGGIEDARFRFWMESQPFTPFLEFLYERRWILLLELLGFLVLFFIFYGRYGSPVHSIHPLVECIHRSMVQPDVPPLMEESAFPREFVPLVNAVTKLVETRRFENEQKQEYLQRAEDFNRQHHKYRGMLKNIESHRQNEKTVIEKIQLAIVDSNRDPVILLDRTLRILAMNDAARRSFNLIGQHGSQLQHVELESLFEQELTPADRPYERTLDIRENPSSRPVAWKVRIHVFPDLDESHEVNRILLTLSPEDALPRRPLSPAQLLMHHFGEAILELWHSNLKSPYSLDEQELLKTEFLLRKVTANEAFQTDPVKVLQSFQLDESQLDLDPSLRADGHLDHWEAFFDWFVYLLERMGMQNPAPVLVGSDDTAIRLEWNHSSPLHFDRYFLKVEDATRRLRKELLMQTVEQLRSLVKWHPENPGKIEMEIRLRPMLRSNLRRSPSALNLTEEA